MYCVSHVNIVNIVLVILSAANFTVPRYSLGNVIFLIFHLFFHLLVMLYRKGKRKKGAGDAKKIETLWLLDCGIQLN